MRVGLLIHAFNSLQLHIHGYKALLFPFGNIPLKVADGIYPAVTWQVGIKLHISTADQFAKDRPSVHGIDQHPVLHIWDKKNPHSLP